MHDNIDWHNHIDALLESIASSLERGNLMEAGVRLGVVMEKNLVQRNILIKEKNNGQEN